MKKLIEKWFGFPIYTIDFDGEIRKRRAKYLKDGSSDIITTKIIGKIIGNADGSFPELSYIEKWVKR